MVFILLYLNTIEISAGRPFFSAHIVVAMYFDLEEQLGLLPGTVVLLYDNLKFCLIKCFLCGLDKARRHQKHSQIDHNEYDQSLLKWKETL